MQKLTEKILEHAAGLPEGTPVSAKELLHFGSRAAVDQCLSRLVQRGQLYVPDAAFMCIPLKLASARCPPAIERVVQAIAEVKGETIAPHGAAAANALGFLEAYRTLCVSPPAEMKVLMEDAEALERAAA